MKFKLTLKFYVLLLALIVGATITCLLIHSKGQTKIEKSIEEEDINDIALIPSSEYHGIDVSHYQDIIDWKLVATDKNIQFVYIKATEGATYVDKYYKRNIKGAKKYGLKVGSYHYLSNESPIKSQFKNFTSTVDKDLQDLIPMVDVEVKVEKDSIRLFCNLIKKLYGKDPMIYGTNSSYNKYCAPDFNNYYLLIGRYGDKRPVITGKGHYNIWQFSEKGNIPGIPNQVDLDRFHPDFDLSKILLKESGSEIKIQNNAPSDNEVTKIETLGLIVLYPQFDSVDLVCGTMPSKKDKKVILVAEAAYTGELLKDFKHMNIAGDHVSNGKRYDGYTCDRNTGAFIYYNKKWEFCYKDYSKKMDIAAKNGGAAFAQELLIHKGKQLQTVRKNNNKNQFRALCNHKGKLCVVESKSVISLGDFKNKLLKLGVTDAIYLDMGKGWNHAWYRDNGDVVELHPHTHNYCTNWITFLKNN